ncbi:deacetylase [Sphaerisporangium sp. TRM90804]|uniref:deacetylase n=1 Tax=Sphaerisporangium sp. TRM90804 TaxID=3031113 RepID=UPI00244A6830|nr:deacetylase [Sphaerisporangium sp. TRM90804]MDH2424132.1 deacetylase [Sphaerisporangium sp. TRM90804]
MDTCENRRPSFIVTVDVEADDAWSPSPEIRTENAAHLPRFHKLCERHGLRPTYLVDWTMARSPVFQRFGRSVLERGTGEIGMHLHAWTTPPLVPLTGDDHRHKPFLLEYPEQVVAAKVETASAILREVFGVSPVSHRAGRWMLDETYARVLVEQGYLADCSVTPHVSWSHDRGAPGGPGPRDYSRFPGRPYFLDLGDIGREGDSPLLEVPMTIVPRRYGLLAGVARELCARTGPTRRVARRLLPATAWMRPNGRNRDDMLRLARRALARRHDHVEFMLHSSELMPGGSPYFRTRRGVDRLYADLETVFRFVSSRFTGRTLAEFRALYPARVRPAGRTSAL